MSLYPESTNDSMPSLGTLPHELHCEICQHLTWTDILSLRGTCKTLALATRSRHVWLSLIKENASFFPLSSDYPVSIMDMVELEYFFLRRVRAEVRWISGELPPTRTFPWIFAGCAPVALVEGGRWLLAVAYGGVFAYDLDGPTDQEPQLLIKPDNDSEEQYFRHISIDMDYSELSVAFNVAVILQRAPGPEDSPVPILRVYRVTCVGRKSRLSAKKLASFSVPSGGTIVCLSLSESYVAILRFDRVEVYDWAHCNSDTHIKASIPIVFCHIKLLPGPLLLFISYRRVALYKIKGLQRMPAGQVNVNAMLEPAWEVNKIPTSGGCNISNAVKGLHSLRVAVTMDRQIFGLTIPHENICQTELVPLSGVILPYFELEDFVTGVSKLFASEGGRGFLVDFEWHEDKQRSNWPTLYARDMRRQALPFTSIQGPVFDEISGRVVLPVAGKFVVLEYGSFTEI